MRLINLKCGTGECLRVIVYRAAEDLDYLKSLQHVHKPCMHGLTNQTVDNISSPHQLDSVSSRCPQR